VLHLVDIATVEIVTIFLNTSLKLLLKAQHRQA